jgi:leucyl aminopeptidase
MRFRLRPAKGAATSDACVVFAWRSAPIPTDGVAAPERRLLQAWAATSAFRGNACEVHTLPTWGRSRWPRLILVGLGDRAAFHPGVLRRAMGACARAAVRQQLKHLTVLFNLPLAESPLTPESALYLAALGFREGAYSYRIGRATKTGQHQVERVEVLVPGVTHARTASLARSLQHGELLGDVVNRTRDLANRPGNLAPPRYVAAYARAMARRSGLRCSVWTETRLHSEGCGALLAVAQGSREPARLVALRYPGRGAGKRARPVVLVGKTITFDTGGLSIKPAKNMEWMKYDKSGGMTVLAVMEYVGRVLKPTFPVIGLLACAENMPGGWATRPGDIIRSRSGQTIEVVNTDAEGRLVLADALSVAQDLRPACIVDLATLTGAAVIAVGHVLSAIMGNHQGLAGALQQAGLQTGDRLWPLPLDPDYAGLLYTPFADMKNIGDGTAGTIVGGMFLRRFVSERVPWAHIDLTNAWEEKDQAHAAAGASLFGTALLCDWLARGPLPVGSA